jgi:hypothetical protein
MIVCGDASIRPLSDSARTHPVNLDFRESPLVKNLSALGWLSLAFALLGLSACTMDSIIGQDEPIDNEPVPISGTNFNIINSAKNASLRCSYQASVKTVSCRALARTDNGFVDAEGVSPDYSLSWSVAPAAGGAAFNPPPFCAASEDQLSYDCGFNSDPGNVAVTLTASSRDGSDSASSGINVSAEGAPASASGPTTLPLASDGLVKSLRIQGLGFDGDLNMCLDITTGRVTFTQVSGSDYDGFVNLYFVTDPLRGNSLIDRALGGMPRNLSLRGGWTGVTDANPVVTEWRRLESGRAPIFRASRSGNKRCLQMIDGPDGRPGPVGIKVEWNLVR